MSRPARRFACAPRLVGPRRIARRRALGLLFALAPALHACGDAGAPLVAQGSVAAAEPVSDGDDVTELERLMALGYIDATPEPVDPGQVGVVEIDPERVQDGYRLYCTKGRAVAELVALDGTPVHRWSDERSRSWPGCALLPSGDLVVVGVDPSPDPGAQPEDGQRHLRRLDWHGNEIWRNDLLAHHDVFALADGDLLTLSLGYVEDPSIHPEVPVRDDYVVRLGADGEVKARRSLLEAFRSNPDELRLLPIEPSTKWGRRHVDVIHANTIVPVPATGLEGRHPLYTPGNVIVTSRHQNVVAIVEWETNRLLWAWGQGVLSGPHEGRMLQDGNILVFDNGVERQRSRVLEVDPLSKQVVWEYAAEVPEDFFTPGRGGALRLLNGNTLITDSNQGAAFEVTPSGERVWGFLNPYLTERDERLTFRRMRHYPREVVDAILTGPGDESGAS